MAKPYCQNSRNLKINVVLEFDFIAQQSYYHATLQLDKNSPIFYSF